MLIGPKIHIGANYYLDLDTETLFKSNHAISLSRTQFRILYYLAINIDKPVTTEDLIAFTWGQGAFRTREELYVYINRIRIRLEDNVSKPKYLLSLRGYGYVLLKINNNCDNLAREKKDMIFYKI